MEIQNPNSTNLETKAKILSIREGHKAITHLH